MGLLPDKLKPRRKLGPLEMLGAMLFPVAELAEVKRGRDRKCKRVGRSHFGKFIFARRTTIDFDLRGNKERRSQVLYNPQ